MGRRVSGAENEGANVLILTSVRQIEGRRGRTFGLRYPNRDILLLIPPIPMKARYFVIVVALLELWSGVAGTRQGVAHFAHLAGMLVGLALILARRRRRRP